MRLHALTVGRNEADRYLTLMLGRTAEVVDTHFFFDDQSDDGTADVAADCGAKADVRPDDVPSFLEHEGRFRQYAYDRFETLIGPDMGDWILAIDCDEILVAPDDDIRNRLMRSIELARGCNAIMMPIPECFGFDDDGTPLCRTDGFWGGIRGTRLFRWQPKGKFADRPMGCGSEPTYATKPPTALVTLGVELMHLGYADPADVAAKYERYNALAHGHSDKHIQSIPAKPTLHRWEGRWDA